jgi:hypothetical protein
MKIRLTGLPAETTPAINALNDADSPGLIEVTDPYPNRGDSQMVRVYIQAHLHTDSRAVP